MKKITILLLSMVLLLNGCGQTTNKPIITDEQMSNTDSTNAETDSDSQPSDNEDDSEQDKTEDTLIEDEEVDEQGEDESENKLSLEQKNSIAMLNYLASISQEINDSQNSKMYLEEAYSSLINNTNPEKVNELSESQLCNLLDIIEKYRMISVKRERLQYIYEQNKAQAIREAIPNPLAVLNATNAFSMTRLVGSIAYMAIDSYNSYKSYTDQLDQEYLQDGWELDDEASANIHDNRKTSFSYMIDIVREYNLPGYLALSEKQIENFVSWKNTDNIHSKIQFFESKKDIYKAFGSFWLELADCYYESGQYKKCLNAIKEYENLDIKIFRKDYYLAKLLPKAIAACQEIYKDDKYVSEATKYIKLLKLNAEESDWASIYFAAQVNLDLYAKTNDNKYISDAYEMTLDNVNNLVLEQKKLNKQYVSDIKYATVIEDQFTDEDLLEEAEEQTEEYNEYLEEKREIELPSVSEALKLNCDLLFAIADELKIDESEQKRISNILTSDVFLTLPLAEKYSFNNNSDTAPKIVLDGDDLEIPVNVLTDTSIIKVTVTNNGKSNVYEDWEIDEVERPEKELASFIAYYDSDLIEEQEWSENSKVKIEIFESENSKENPVVVNLEVSYYKEAWIFGEEKVEFKQVK